MGKKQNITLHTKEIYNNMINNELLGNHEKSDGWDTSKCFQTNKRHINPKTLY